MARMRYAAQALAELKKQDPDTPVTLNYLRALAASGKIPVHYIGRRRLINYDALLEFLANPEAQDDSTGHKGQIRRVEVGGGRCSKT